MALDELIFGKLSRFFKNRKPPAPVIERTVSLQELKTRLTIIATAISGKSIEIFPAIKEGGFKGDNYFLPGTFSFYHTRELNSTYYLYRIFYLAAQQKNEINWYDAAPLTDKDAIRLSLENKDRILQYLFNEFSSLAAIHEVLLKEQNPETGKEIEKSWLYGRWMQNTKQKSEKKKTNAATANIRKAIAATAKTIIQSKPVEEIHLLDINKKQQEDYVLTHNFEKVETADEFNGVWRDFDGDDDLEAHADALDELNMKYTVRTDDTTHSVYEASFTENATAGESEEVKDEAVFFPYDEWDYSKMEYKKLYSKVFSSHIHESDSAYYHTTIKQNNSILVQLRKMLTSINNKWQQQKLQAQGKEIDIDMAVNRFADIYSGHTPSDKVYISDRKNEKEISITLLLDISLSSDSYAAGNRVIDIEKQTAILFGEILNEYRIDFSINCFYSKTRNYCAYSTVKGFDESWNTAKFKTGTAQPSGYTRIGPALRHSGALLQKREAKNKWIILLSDGKPNDYDRYEGRYGIQDVKQALRELTAQDIHCFAIAIEANAKYYLPQMFGQSHYQIVSSPVELLTSLIKLYERIRYHC